ncbi:hypothetical protein N9U58_00070 [Pelagibacteraceae bacterium]|nr:hypothetical protein [Pelagibacteraceae bacterium]
MRKITKKKDGWGIKLFIFSIWVLFTLPLINLFQIYGAGAAIIILVLYLIIKDNQKKEED